jgi:hypothetical protein
MCCSAALSGKLKLILPLHCPSWHRAQAVLKIIFDPTWTSSADMTGAADEAPMPAISIVIKKRFMSLATFPSPYVEQRLHGCRE